MSVDRLYQEELMDHYRRSPYRRTMEHADKQGKMLNPSCGDAISFNFKIHEGIIADVCFEGTGCVISQATASLICQDIIGKELNYLRLLDTEAILKLVKIPLGPTRVRCALLSLQALQQIIDTQ